MSGPISRRLRSLAALAALLAATAGANAATPSKATVVLRGSQTVQAPEATPTPAASSRPAVDPATGPFSPLDLPVAPRFRDNPAPRFSLDPAPRVGGLDLIGGGAQCRMACAKTRYLCRATDDEDDSCDGPWGQCVASCTETSSNGL